MKFTFVVFALLVFFSCAGEDSQDQNDNKEEKGVATIHRIATKDVDNASYDFNGDGIQDGIKQMSVNEEGQMRVVYVYIKEDHGFVPTYDEYENQMVYPADTIRKTDAGHFKFMYHSGDYFIFDFEKEEGNWIARQVQE